MYPSVIVELTDSYYREADIEQKARLAYQLSCMTVDVYPCIYDASFKVASASLVGALKAGLTPQRARMTCRGSIQLYIVIDLHEYLSKIACL